jgi:hypothetical protein
MTTGNLVIISRGAKDRFLTGNPQTTFFKSVYKRHTHFVLYKKALTCEAVPDFGKKVSFKVDPVGDLISGLYIDITLPALQQVQNSSTYVGYVNSFMASAIEYVEILFNGKLIDRIRGQYLDIKNELFYDEGRRFAHDKMLGKYQSEVSLETNALASKTIAVEIPFWFTDGSHFALPLIAMQYTDIIINVKFRDALSCVVSDVELTSVLDSGGSPLSMTNCNMRADFITLDQQERKVFATQKHEYLIYQHQFNEEFVGPNITDVKMNLSFENPIRFMTWVIQEIPTKNTQLTSTSGNKWTKYSDPITGGSPLDSAEIKFNGTPYQERLNYFYYLHLSPFKYFINSPRKYIFTHSFSLNPIDWKPSGQINFSKIDKKMIHFILNTHTNSKVINVYANSYNVLRIISGIAGLAFT